MTDTIDAVTVDEVVDRGGWRSSSWRRPKRRGWIWWARVGC